MRLTFIVTVDTDEEWTARHKEYTPEFIRNITENRLSDALRYDLAYDQVKIEEVTAKLAKSEAENARLREEIQSILDRNRTHIGEVVSERRARNDVESKLSALIASVREIVKELGEFSRSTGWDDRPGWRICARWRDALQQAIGDTQSDTGRESVSQPTQAHLRV
jgi:uncharacterized coiled-coil DUF342 family protein